MDGRAAISVNVEALKRIVAGLVGMAGSYDSRVHQEKEEKTLLLLPRHLRLAILRLLRPAESAARRLIIAAARGLVVTLPSPRKTAPKAVDATPLLRRFGIAVVLCPEDIGSIGRPRQAAKCPARPRSLALPLFDQPRRPPHWRGRPVPAHAAPRIMFPGLAEPHRLPPPPSCDDQVDCTRLRLRLAALAAALDDVPGQARRLARLRARQRKPVSGRFQRTSPLRPGRPPGGHLSHFDPSETRRANIRDIDEVLAHAHALALYALQYPDTS